MMMTTGRKKLKREQDGGTEKLELEPHSSSADRQRTREERLTQDTVYEATDQGFQSNSLLNLPDF